MPTTLIVLAHPESRSFNGAWARASAEAAGALGHTVLWSDLAAMGFDPVERAGHLPDCDGPFDPLKAQEGAAEDGRLPRDVSAEADKIEAADQIIFHFPIWWFGPPALLKGWFDRVFVHGRLHSVDERFDRGLCRGKRALFCVTTGASAAECGPDGKEGNLKLLLWPLAQTLRYLGITVLDPATVHGVHGYLKGAERAALETRLTGVLAGQKDLIADLDRRPALAFNADTDFDAAGRLLPGRPSHSPFIQTTRV